MDTKQSGIEALARDKENFICGCTALSLDALRRRVATDPSLSFETLIAETGAGTKCTACLLDLEYHFVEAQRAPGKGPAVKPEEEDEVQDTSSFKQRVYRWLDRISPLVPYPFTNTVPVIYGPQIEQWIWITNRSMLFEGDECAPGTHIELIIRDKSGRIVQHEKKEVGPETTWRFPVSVFLNEAAPISESEKVGIGSMEIRRRSVQAGIRGTTRPQIEIVTPKAACAVHSQALSGAGQRWFGCVYHPNDERILFSLLNGVGHEAKIELSYPMGIQGVEPIVRSVTLPPFGAALHELALPADVAAKIGDEAISVSWRAESAHKVWVICASRELDRFSIDHV